MIRAVVAAAASLALSGCSLLRDGTDLDGRYRTSWGPAEVRGNPTEVRIHYARGEARCERDDKRLDCRWSSGGTSGRAQLTVQADRSLSGTFGYGDAASDGGAWVFVKQ